MIHLNIAPNNLKKEIKLSSINIQLKNVYGILIISSSLCAIILLIMYLALNVHFIQTVNETTQLIKSSKNNANDVREINNLINYMDNIQENSVEWSDLLKFLKASSPPDINYSKISINRNENTMSLLGRSETRDSLLSLKTSMEKTDYFNKIDFPIKNLLEKSNINFEIKAVFKNYELQ